MAARLAPQELIDHTAFAKPPSANNSADLALMNLRTGVLFGLGLAVLCISSDYEALQPYARASMFGWLSLFLAGGLYLIAPNVAKGWLPYVHCILVSIGAILLVPAMIGMNLGYGSMFEVFALGGYIAVCAGFAAFVLTVMKVNSLTLDRALQPRHDCAHVADARPRYNEFYQLGASIEGTMVSAIEQQVQTKLVSEDTRDKTSSDDLKLDLDGRGRRHQVGYNGRTFSPAQS